MIRRLLYLLLLTSAWLHGQVIEVKGTVYDETGLGTLPGAVIKVLTTAKGSTTNIDGQYVIAVAPDDSLSFSFVGYQEQIIAVQGRTEIDIVLKPTQEVLDAVIVTALGISREEKSLGYSVSKMDVKTATEVRDPNLVNSMQGKLAGVDITKTSGGPGASSRILIRGNSSLVNNNQPLIVLDGIPMDNTNTGTGGTWGGIDYGSPISDVNPDDIESLTVLKGPSAAALYGSRALNGVIVITTKSGSSAGKDWQFSMNSNSSVETPYFLKEFQDVYGAGSRGVFKYTEEGIPFFETNRPSTPTFASSWGPEMLGQTYIDWNGDTTTYSPQPDNYRDFFQTGYTLTNSISVMRGGKYPLRISVTDLRNRGTSPTSTFKRNNLNVSLGGLLAPRTTFVIKGSYSDQRAHNRINQSNGHNAARNIIMMPRNVSAESMMNFEDSDGNEQVWYTDWGWIGNPFYTLQRNINYDNRQRFIGNVSVSQDLNPWLSAMGRLGIDRFNENRHSRFATGSFIVPEGQVNEQDIQFEEVNMDFLLTASCGLSDRIALTVNAGGNRMFQSRTNDTREAQNLINPGIYTYENAASADRDRRDLLFERALNSLYGTALIEYDRFFYLELTARNDWSSTLPANYNSYFYPSANVGYVFTEHFGEGPSVIEFGKLRASIAKVGQDSDPYLTSILYDSLQTINGVTLSSINNPFPLVDLRPEFKSSYEFGTNLRFFKGRFDIDFTYYWESTTNQIFVSPVSNTSGFRQAVFNAGEIQNQGIELLLQSQIVNGKKFKWSTRFNFSRNRNEVVSLLDDIERFALGNQWRIDVIATPGQAYGAIYGYGIQRDESGNALLRADGTYLRTEEQQLLGNSNPDWKLGFSNSFGYRNWSLNLLLDIQHGGDIYSATNMYMHGYSGNAVATLEGREEWYASEADREEAGISANVQDGDNYLLNWEANGGYQVTGVYAEGTIINGEDVSGQSVDRFIDPQVYWSQHAVWTNEIHEPFVYDASYVKLREVALSYRFNEEAFGRKLRNVTMTLSGRNLWLIHSNVPNIDPEATYSNGNGQGVEYASYPITRSIGLNIKVDF